MRAERLGVKTSPSSVKAGGKYASVVEDEEIAGPQKIRKLAELAVFEGTIFGGKVQKTRSSTIGQRLLSD